MRNKISQIGTVLSRAEQCHIMGGGRGTCAYNSAVGVSGRSGVDRETAESYANALGVNWCCDSCCSVGWLNNDHKASLGCDVEVSIS